MEKYINRGLTTTEAKAGLMKYGKNLIASPDQTIFSILLRQFSSPLIILLVFATIISFILNDNTDGAVIALILMVNTIIGFSQEYRSNNAYEKLKSYISAETNCFRDGKLMAIAESELVPGDMVQYKLGDIVTADSFVVEETELVIDESSLTGESLGVTKQVNKNEDPKLPSGVIYSGSYITKGEVIAKVFATGKNSTFGNIANLTINSKKNSGYELNLRYLSKDLLVISILFVIFTITVQLLLAKSTSLIGILLFGLAIAVTIIPEALPVIAALTLTENSLKLAKKGVVVKRLSAMEDFGNIDLICTDKTGTLTTNNLVVREIDTNNLISLVESSYLLSSSSLDPFDGAINNYIKTQKDIPLSKAKLEENLNYTEISFDPKLKFSGRDFNSYLLIKGTPEYICANSNNIKNKEKLLATVVEKSHRGYRAISIARKSKLDNSFSYLGTYFFADEIKPSVTEVLAKAKNLGIDIKIITGDSVAVSSYVAKRVNLIKSDNEIIEANDLLYGNEKQLLRQLAKVKVIARADPDQKYKIIKALQTTNQVCYIGDGINDAPSIKLANVGMVVDTASDIAKSTADLILITKDLTVIIDGIADGRRAFENIDKYIKTTLVGNFSNFFTIGLFSLFLPYLPITATQILITNIISDITSLGFAKDNVDQDQLHKPQQHSIAKLLKMSVILGLIALVFNILFYVWAKDFAVTQIQTLWFEFTSISGLLIFLSMRTRKLFFKSRPGAILSILLILALIFTVGFSLLGSIQGSLFSSITIKQLLVVIGLSLIYFVINDVCKSLIYRNK